METSHLSLSQISRYDHIRDSIGTGRGIPRVVCPVGRIEDLFEKYGDPHGDYVSPIDEVRATIDLPTGTEIYECTRVGRLRKWELKRVIRESAGPRLMVDMATWNNLVKERNTLDSGRSSLDIVRPTLVGYTGRVNALSTDRRKSVNTPDRHPPSIFGSDRFRAFNPEPAFPVVCGFVAIHQYA